MKSVKHKPLDSIRGISENRRSIAAINLKIKGSWPLSKESLARLTAELTEDTIQLSELISIQKKPRSK
jgi:hypothetical protein